MNRPTRFAARLIAIQLGVGLVTSSLVIALAPRLLLLERGVGARTLPLAFWGSGILAVYAVVVTVTLARPIRPLLRGLAAGATVIQPGDLLRLYALPAQIALFDTVAAVAMAASTLLPRVRPPTNDFATQFALVLLVATIASAASLPSYVMMRRATARVLELVPLGAARLAATSRADDRSKRRGMRRRVLAAVAAPVAFVALGASLLSYAHARALDTAAREQLATELVVGVMDTVNGDRRGAEEALAQAAARGISGHFELDVPARPVSVFRGDDGQTRLEVPLSVGRTVLVFDTAHLSPVTGAYVFLALVASALAGLLGALVGRFLSIDVQLATREVRGMGVLEVLRGTILKKKARFRIVQGLMLAIDALGGVFREFAAAQQRAIEMRGLTERMRGLFLASMSHDLKGPLNAVLGFVELVRRKPLSPAQEESLTIIEQRGRELLLLIDTILESARAEAGELNVAPEWTMVGDFVMGAVLETRELIAGTEVDITAEIQPGVPKMFVDGERVMQALIAVLLTAVRLRSRGHVTVRATCPEPGEHLQIAVETSGQGDTLMDRDQIFQSFHDANRARRHGSLGLGLSLARAILAAHQGTIAVDTTQAGDIVFHLLLPIEARTVTNLRSLRF